MIVRLSGTRDNLGCGKLDLTSLCMALDHKYLIFCKVVLCYVRIYPFAAKVLVSGRAQSVKLDTKPVHRRRSYLYFGMSLDLVKAASGFFWGNSVIFCKLEVYLGMQLIICQQMGE